MQANVHLETGISYGIVRSDALHADLVYDLLYGHQAVDYSYREAKQEFMLEHKHLSEDEAEHAFVQEYQCDEPHIAGVLHGVHYQTSWLGGALHFIITFSPYITHEAGAGSPCVPNMGVIDAKGGTTCYTVPAGWFDNE